MIYEVLLMQIDINFLLKHFIMVVYSINFCEIVVIEQNIRHNFEIGIKSERILFIFKTINPFVDAKQIVMRIVVKTILVE